MNAVELLAYMGITEDFHFLRPVWLIGVPLTLLLGFFLVKVKRSTLWEDVIPAQMLEALRVSGGKSGKRRKWLIPFCLAIACLAAAGPTWKKIPVPTTQAQHALIILLDLSPSMLATDLVPDRLTRAKYKLIDILRSREDGQTALIAYAGSPHRVAPLTDDVSTIEALLPALTPSTMPTQGSATESAVELAAEMFQSAGVLSGDILLITDGVAPEAQRSISSILNGKHRLSILGVGTIEAVPIPRPEGGFLSDNRGEIILTELNRDELQILAGFNRGRYVEIQPDGSDIAYLLQEQPVLPAEAEAQFETLYDSWEDIGYYLVLLLLPIAAYSFRSGLIFCLPILILPMAFSPQKAQAFEWQDLWLTPDQQGAAALENGDPATAADKFKDPEWAAYARLLEEDYEAASTTLETSEKKPTARAHYNHGNALALNSELEEAISAYDKALELDPDMEDAKHNKSVVEELLKQQENQEQEQNQDQNQDNNSDDQQDSDQSENDQDSEGQDESDSENEDESESKSESESESEQSEDEQSDSEQSEGDESENGQPDSEQSDSPEENPDQQYQNTNGQDPEDQNEDETEEPQEESAGNEPSDSEEQESEQELAQQAEAEETPEELTPASEQWLRGIPDDPSGLLRRKFEDESKTYQQDRRFNVAPPNEEPEVRY